MKRAAIVARDRGSVHHHERAFDLVAGPPRPIPWAAVTTAANRRGGVLTHGPSPEEPGPPASGADLTDRELQLLVLAELRELRVIVDELLTEFGPVLARFGNNTKGPATWAALRSMKKGARGGT